MPVSAELDSRDKFIIKPDGLSLRYKARVINTYSGEISSVHRTPLQLYVAGYQLFKKIKKFKFIKTDLFCKQGIAQQVKLKFQQLRYITFSIKFYPNVREC